jgi:hypothetical protein
VVTWDTSGAGAVVGISGAGEGVDVDAFVGTIWVATGAGVAILLLSVHFYWTLVIKYK